MRTNDPVGDLWVVDGEIAWKFSPSQDSLQVIGSQVESDGGGFNFYQTFLEDPRGRFEAVHEGRESMGRGRSC